MEIEKTKYKYNNVLLIDDNELDNFINERMVKVHDFGRHVYISTNGKSALEFINNLVVSGGIQNGTYPQVIFVDLNMPLMSGFEFIEEFRKINYEKPVSCKIVILTSSISNFDKVKSEELGGITFVNKPLTKEILDEL